MSEEQSEERNLVGGTPSVPGVGHAATPSPAETIRTALQGAMVGAWGRENALRALSEMEAENERLRKALWIIVHEHGLINPKAVAETALEYE